MRYNLVTYKSYSTTNIMNQNLTECCEITTLGVINILLVKTRQSVTAYFWWSFGSLLDNRKGSYESGTGNNMADTAISF